MELGAGTGTAGAIAPKDEAAKILTCGAYIAREEALRREVRFYLSFVFFFLCSVLKEKKVQLTYMSFRKKLGGSNLSVTLMMALMTI